MDVGDKPFDESLMKGYFEIDGKKTPQPKEGQSDVDPSTEMGKAKVGFGALHYLQLSPTKYTRHLGIFKRQVAHQDRTPHDQQILGEFNRVSTQLIQAKGKITELKGEIAGLNQKIGKEHHLEVKKQLVSQRNEKIKELVSIRKDWAQVSKNLKRLDESLPKTSFVATRNTYKQIGKAQKSIDKEFQGLMKIEGFPRHRLIELSKDLNRLKVHDTTQEMGLMFGPTPSKADFESVAKDLRQLANQVALSDDPTNQATYQEALKLVKEAEELAAKGDPPKNSEASKAKPILQEDPEVMRTLNGGGTVSGISLRDYQALLLLVEPGTEVTSDERSKSSRIADAIGKLNDEDSAIKPHVEKLKARLEELENAVDTPKHHMRNRFDHHTSIGRELRILNDPALSQGGRRVILRRLKQRVEYLKDKEVQNLEGGGIQVGEVKIPMNPELVSQDSLEEEFRKYISNADSQVNAAYEALDPSLLEGCVEYGRYPEFDSELAKQMGGLTIPDYAIQTNLGTCADYGAAFEVGRARIAYAYDGTGKNKDDTPTRNFSHAIYTFEQTLAKELHQMQRGGNQPTSEQMREAGVKAIIALNREILNSPQKDLTIQGGLNLVVQLGDRAHLFTVGDGAITRKGEGHTLEVLDREMDGISLGMGEKKVKEMIECREVSVREGDQFFVGSDGFLGHIEHHAAQKVASRLKSSEEFGALIEKLQVCRNSLDAVAWVGNFVQRGGVKEYVERRNPGDKEEVCRVLGCTSERLDAACNALDEKIAQAYAHWENGNQAEFEKVAKELQLHIEGPVNFGHSKINCDLKTSLGQIFQTIKEKQREPTMMAVAALGRGSAPVLSTLLAVEVGSLEVDRSGSAVQIQRPGQEAELEPILLGILMEAFTEYRKEDPTREFTSLDDLLESERFVEMAQNKIKEATSSDYNVGKHFIDLSGQKSYPNAQRTTQREEEAFQAFVAKNPGASFSDYQESMEKEWFSNLGDRLDGIFNLGKTSGSERRELEMKLYNLLGHVGRAESVERILQQTQMTFLVALTGAEISADVVESAKQIQVTQGIEEQGKVKRQEMPMMAESGVAKIDPEELLLDGSREEIEEIAASFGWDVPEGEFPTMQQLHEQAKEMAGKKPITAEQARAIETGNPYVRFALSCVVAKKMGLIPHPETGSRGEHFRPKATASAWEKTQAVNFRLATVPLGSPEAGVFGEEGASMTQLAHQGADKAFHDGAGKDDFSTFAFIAKVPARQTV